LAKKRQALSALVISLCACHAQRVEGMRESAGGPAENVAFRHHRTGFRHGV
jgi:hypothetical protein